MLVNETDTVVRLCVPQKVRGISACGSDKLIGVN